jgi:hypothetical protein
MASKALADLSADIMDSITSLSDSFDIGALWVTEDSRLRALCGMEASRVYRWT